MNGKAAKLRTQASSSHLSFDEQCLNCEKVSKHTLFVCVSKWASLLAMMLHKHQHQCQKTLLIARILIRHTQLLQLQHQWLHRSSKLLLLLLLLLQHLLLNLYVLLVVSYFLFGYSS